jgi:hypothetical protein
MEASHVMQLAWLWHANPALGLGFAMAMVSVLTGFGCRLWMLRACFQSPGQAAAAYASSPRSLFVHRLLELCMTGFFTGLVFFHLLPHPLLHASMMMADETAVEEFVPWFFACFLGAAFCFLTLDVIWPPPAPHGAQKRAQHRHANALVFYFGFTWHGFLMGMSLAWIPIEALQSRWVIVLMVSHKLLDMVMVHMQVFFAQQQQIHAAHHAGARHAHAAVSMMTHKEWIQRYSWAGNRYIYWTSLTSLSLMPFLGIYFGQWCLERVDNRDASMTLLYLQGGAAGLFFYLGLLRHWPHVWHALTDKSSGGPFTHFALLFVFFASTLCVAVLNVSTAI